LNRRRVQVTAVARDQLAAVKAWQLENGLDVTLLGAEVHEAFLLLSLIPGAGTPYPNREVGGLRRLFLRRIAYHLYYTFTDEAVVVRAFWHTSRGHGPELA
jgi:plasmid stabilization system protein ParE